MSDNAIMLHIWLTAVGVTIGMAIFAIVMVGVGLSVRIVREFAAWSLRVFNGKR